MTIWLVRAGKYGEREDFAQQNNVVVIGWILLDHEVAVLQRRFEACRFAK